MQAILISSLKWLVTTILLPIVQNWVAAYFAAKKKIADYKETKAQAVKKAETYEQDPSSDNANNMP